MKACNFIKKRIKKTKKNKKKKQKQKTKKTKVSREIAFVLISLFHVQIQEPASRSTTTRAFVFLPKFAEFYYHKIFETRSL